MRRETKEMVIAMVAMVLITALFPLILAWLPGPGWGGSSTNATNLGDTSADFEVSWALDVKSWDVWWDFSAAPWRCEERTCYITEIDKVRYDYLQNGYTYNSTTISSVSFNLKIETGDKAWVKIWIITAEGLWHLIYSKEWVSGEDRESSVVLSLSPVITTFGTWFKLRIECYAEARWGEDALAEVSNPRVYFTVHFNGGGGS